MNWVFPNLDIGDIGSSAAILAPHNADVDDLNLLALQLMPGEVIELKSADSIMADTGVESDNLNHLYPIEYLNSIVLPSLPHHKLLLKVKAVVLLTRTLDTTKGLCNGTRLMVLGVINCRILHVLILNGTRAFTGDTANYVPKSFPAHEAYIPRIDLECTDIPVPLKRRQFPVRLAFAMTINKAQGQSLKKVGIYLNTNPVFAHGQLYVALSRAGFKETTKIFIGDVKNVQGKFPLIEGTFTKNIVYKEFFR